MITPSRLAELNFNEIFAEKISKLTSAKIKKLFQESEELKHHLNQERIYEQFIGERIGLQDLAEYIEHIVKEQTNNLFEATQESIDNTIDQTFIYIEGSMNEVADVMEQMGINLPDGMDLLPGASELILGVRLLMDIKNVNNDFEGISSDKKANIAAAKALVTMSKFGVTFTLTSLGTAAGGSAGGLIGGVGALVGGPAGALAGVVSAGYINKKIAPHAQEISYRLLSIQKEDLIYYKNKKRIDKIGQGLLASKERMKGLSF